MAAVVADNPTDLEAVFDDEGQRLGIALFGDEELDLGLTDALESRPAGGVAALSAWNREAAVVF